MPGACWSLSMSLIKSSARNVGDLLAILQFDFGRDIVTGFESCDRIVHEYDRRSRNPLQDEVKIGTVLGILWMGH